VGSGVGGGATAPGADGFGVGGGRNSVTFGAFVPLEPPKLFPPLGPFVPLGPKFSTHVMGLPREPFPFEPPFDPLTPTLAALGPFVPLEPLTPTLAALGPFVPLEPLTPTLAALGPFVPLGPFDPLTPTLAALGPFVPLEPLTPTLAALEPFGPLDPRESTEMEPLDLHLSGFSTTQTFAWLIRNKVRETIQLNTIRTKNRQPNILPLGSWNPWVPWEYLFH
jgi:hypothetical protein